jgi:Mrp family chromosome partitioning ATPase
MSRISDFLTTGAPVVVAPALPFTLQFGGDPIGSVQVADSLWDELQEEAQALFGSILRAKAADGTPVRLIGLTSIYRQEGVTTIASVLARSAASQRRTLLIEANWMHPSLGELCGVSSERGLIEVLSDDYRAAGCIRELSTGVSLLTVGQTSNGRTMPIPADRFQPFLREVAEDFELVLVDLPSIRETPATCELSNLLDGVALVVESERVHWQAGQRELNRMRQSGAHLLGAVLNKRRDYVPNWLYRIL